MKLPDVISENDVIHFTEVNKKNIDFLQYCISAAGHCNIIDWMLNLPTKYTSPIFITLRVRFKGGSFVERKVQLGQWVMRFMDGQKFWVSVASDERFRERYTYNEKEKRYEKSISSD